MSQKGDIILLTISSTNIPILKTIFHWHML